MRLFLGIPIPPAIRKSLAIYRETFPAENLKPVTPDNYHITICFFGEQAEKKVGEINKKIASVTADIIQFPLQFDSITYAPPKKEPTMIWASYGSSDAFTQMVRSVEATLSPVIHFADNREGHEPIPHITLARFKKQSTGELPQIELDPITVDSVSLFETTKTHEGSRYTILHSFSLKLHLF